MSKLLTLAGTAVLVTTAAVAGAQMMGGNDNGMGSPDPIVAPDGTVLVFQPVADPAATTPTGVELVAVTPAGAVAWREPLGFGVHDLALAGNLVVLTQTAGTGPGGNSGDLATATSSVTALQLASGVQAWSTALDGIARSVAPAGDRIYVRVVKPSATSTPRGGTGGGMHGGGNGGGTRGGSGGGGNGGSGGGQGMNGTFSLVALGLDGQVLWTLPLAN